MGPQHLMKVHVPLKTCFPGSKLNRFSQSPPKVRIIEKEQFGKEDKLLVHKNIMIREGKSLMKDKSSSNHNLVFKKRTNWAGIT